MRRLIVAALLFCLPGLAAPAWGPYRGANTTPVLSEEDVRAFAVLGGNLLRISFTAHPLMDKKPPYAFREEMFENLDRMLAWCEIG